jgi:putative DNA primase/helicase
LESITLEDVEFSTLIACENGLLDVERGTLSEFTPNAMPNHTIPVKFDREAKCPNWDEFLKQVVAAEDITLLQEWSGFLLLPDYRKHKILWVHGVGRNGKGVWVRTMEGMLGQENCSSVSLEEFDGSHRFAMYRLHDKLFNPCSEPTTTKILQTPLLKRVTGQDTIDGEIKGKQQTVNFRNTAKLTVIGNKFPKINDQTIAFQDRMMFIKFPNEYIGKAQIDDLERVWLDDLKERSGILNWQLEGLHRFLSQGVFTESKSQTETMLEFQRVSDSISAFLHEQCVLGPNRLTVRSEAYNIYKEYCDLIGTQPENDKTFTQRLKNTPKVKDGTTRINGKKERAWIGLTVNPFSDENGTDGAVGTLVAYPAEFQQSENKSESREGVPTVPSVPSFEEHTCIGVTIGSDIMLAVKDWCRTNRDERGEIDLNDLTAFVTNNLELDNPQRVIAKAFEKGIVAPSPKPGKVVVI